MEIVSNSLMSFKCFTIEEAYSEKVALDGVKDWLERLPANARGIAVFNVSTVFMGFYFTTYNNMYGSCLLFNYGGVWRFDKSNGVWNNGINLHN